MVGDASDNAVIHVCRALFLLIIRSGLSALNNRNPFRNTKSRSEKAKSTIEVNTIKKSKRFQLSFK